MLHGEGNEKVSAQKTALQPWTPKRVAARKTYIALLGPTVK
jgi:hypothetical protein